MGDKTDNKLFLPIILGTNRKDRKSVFVAEWLRGEMQSGPRSRRVFST